MSKTPEELQADLEAALASIKKLEDKNKELQSEKQKAKADADEAREAAEEAAEEKARADKDVEALEKSITKKFEKQIADLTKANDAYVDELTGLKVDGAIRENLTRHGFDPVHSDILFDAFKAKSEMKEGVAKIGDESIEEYISTFAASDAGKRYIAAPANSGANAPGSRTAAPAVPGVWSFTEYSRMKQSDPEGAKAYWNKHNPETPLSDS